MTSRRFLLYAIAILSCLCVSAQRFEFNYEGVLFKAKINGKYVTITSFDYKAQDVVIPAAINYDGTVYPVKEIDVFGNAFYKTRTLVIAEGVEVIGKYAFSRFTKLENVTLPSTIASIGRNAFPNSEKLSFSLPESIEERYLREGKPYPFSEVMITAIGTIGDKSKNKKSVAVAAVPLQEEEVEVAPQRPVVRQVRNNVDINIPVVKNVNKNTYCVIIANENYKDVPVVDFAINDGKTFREYCIRTLGVPDNQIRFYPDAGFADVRKALAFLKQIHLFDPQAKLIFYYAGHGMPEEKGNSAHLLPVDGIPTEMSTCISLASLYKELGEIKAQSVTVFLDACFSGMARTEDEKPVLAGRMVAQKVKDEMLTGNVLVMSAASGDETALPLKDRRHGLFTYCLLETLKKNKGEVTMGELFDEVHKNVVKTSILENDKQQSPSVNVSASLKSKWREMKF